MSELSRAMNSKPVLYDVFSGGGGSARGYQLAGFEVWGVDNRPQPRYCGDRFLQMDAFEFFEAVRAGVYPMPSAWHASPPCQGHSALRFRWGDREYPDLISATRDALEWTGKPYVIENVMQAPLGNPLVLCGSMFGLKVIRHRRFETKPVLWFPPAPCSHPRNAVGRRGHLGDREWMTVTGHFSDIKKAGAAMGVDWMTQRELAQAIPPAYCHFIGARLLESLSLERVS